MYLLSISAPLIIGLTEPLSCTNPDFFQAKRPHSLLTQERHTALDCLCVT